MSLTQEKNEVFFLKFSIYNIKGGNSGANQTEPIFYRSSNWKPT